MDRYLNLPDATAEALRGGWMHTGDVGYCDEDGYLFVTDRKHDMIVSGGENIYPREVEDVLFGHPAVADVAIVAMPSARTGEMGCAFIIPRAGHSLARLLNTEGRLHPMIRAGARGNVFRIRQIIREAGGVSRHIYETRHPAPAKEA